MSGIVFLLGRPYVFDLQLHHVALEYIVLDGVCYVETALRLDVACRSALSESNTVDDVARL